MSVFALEQIVANTPSESTDTLSIDHTTSKIADTYSSPLFMAKNSATVKKNTRNLAGRIVTKGGRVASMQGRTDCTLLLHAPYLIPASLRRIQVLLCLPHDAGLGP